MSALTPYASTRKAIAIALDAADYKMPHATLAQLPEPFFLIPGDARLPAIPLTTGTVVVTGSLEVTGPVDFHQTGKPIVNLVVVEDCTLGLAYVDAFLVVGGDLRVGTLVADSNYKGGVFVGGDLIGHTLVINDTGVEVDGQQYVEHVANTEDLDSAAHALPALFVDDSPEPRQLFLALRDSNIPLVPAAKKKPAANKSANKSAAKKPAANKPAANKPAAKKSAKKSAANKPAANKPAAKKSAANKPGAKKSAANKPAANKPVKPRAASTRAPAKRISRSQRRRAG
jgi:hypothetical protein